MKIYYLLFTVTFLLFSCEQTFEQSSGELAFKHVLVIVGDDHSYKAVGAYGNDYIRTPNLDQMAENGILFRNAYATSPICNASRQSILTGKYPHATGVNMLFTPFRDEGNVTIAEHLKEKNFSTAIIGKTHFNNWMWAPLYKDGTPSHGFDVRIERGEYRDYIKSNPYTELPRGLKTRENQQGEGITWAKNAAMLPVGHRASESVAAFFVNEASKFINSGDQRTFTWLAFHEPHAPFVYTIDYHDLYHPDSVFLPSGSPEDDRWIPAIFKDLTEKEKRGIITSYYRSVTHMDHQVGRMLDSLEQSGKLDETLVIYIGDQGYLLNDHKRFEKHSFWEESIRAPFIIMGAGLPKGLVIEDPVSFIDIAPTIMDFLGLEPHDDFQGKSLRSLIETGEDTSQYVFAEYLIDNKAMVTDGRWKYIFTTGSRDINMNYSTGLGPSGMYHRLYDLQNDPTESKNLAYQQEYSKKINDLQEVMLNYFYQTHPEAGNIPDNFNKLGELVWFLEPRDLGGDYEERPARVFEGSEYIPEDVD